MEVKTFRDYTAPDNQQYIRSRLLKWLKHHPMNYQEMADTMKVHRMTMSNFINGRPSTFRVLALIETRLEADGY